MRYKKEPRRRSESDAEIYCLVDILDNREVAWCAQEYDADLLLAALNHSCHHTYLN